MKHLRFLLSFFGMTLLLCGCSARFNGTDYMTAAMNALYKSDYTDYAEMTGLTTTEIADERDSWLAKNTDAFLTLTGAATASEDMRTRITEFLGKVYSNAKYEVIQGETKETVSVTIMPIALLSDNYEALKQYTAAFNEKNDQYAYATMTDTDFCDTYLDGILNILEADLTNLTWQDAITVTLTISPDAEGLYTLSAADLQTITQSIMVWP